MIIWRFVVVSDGLLTALSLWMFVFESCIWDLQPQRAKMVCTLTAVSWISPDSCGGSTRSRRAPLSLDDCQRSDLVAGTAAVTPS